MPRNMSCFHTQRQIRTRTKTVTRRKGWAELRPGDEFYFVEKGQGLKRGEKVKRIEFVRVVSNTPDALNGPTLTPEDVAREGFPGMSPAEFVTMFCKHMGGEPTQRINRIEFVYAEPDTR